MYVCTQAHMCIHVCVYECMRTCMCTCTLCYKKPVGRLLVGCHGCVYLDMWLGPPLFICDLVWLLSPPCRLFCFVLFLLLAILLYYISTLQHHPIFKYKGMWAKESISLFTFIMSMLSKYYRVAASESGEGRGRGGSGFPS